MASIKCLLHARCFPDHCTELKDALGCLLTDLLTSTVTNTGQDEVPGSESYAFSFGEDSAKYTNHR